MAPPKVPQQRCMEQILQGTTSNYHTGRWKTQTTVGQMDSFLQKWHAYYAHNKDVVYCFENKWLWHRVLQCTRHKLEI